MASDSESTDYSSDSESVTMNPGENILSQDDEDIEPIATEEENELYRQTLAAEEEEEAMLKRRYEEQDVHSWYVYNTYHRFLTLK